VSEINASGETALQLFLPLQAGFINQGAAGQILGIDQHAGGFGLRRRRRVDHHRFGTGRFKKDKRSNARRQRKKTDQNAAHGSDSLSWQEEGGGACHAKTRIESSVESIEQMPCQICGPEFRRLFLTKRLKTGYLYRLIGISFSTRRYQKDTPYLHVS
jgi:hypothetical protein